MLKKISGSAYKDVDEKEKEKAIAIGIWIGKEIEMKLLKEYVDKHNLKYSGRFFPKSAGEIKQVLDLNQQAIKRKGLGEPIKHIILFDYIGIDLLRKTYKELKHLEDFGYIIHDYSI